MSQPYIGCVFASSSSPCEGTLPLELIGLAGLVQSKIRVPLFAARTLNAAGQYRVTLSLR